MISKAKILTEVMGYNPLDLEYDRVVNSKDTTDLEYGVQVIFDYYRRHGFPYYQIREDEKHQHMRKMQRFDINTIFKDNQIIQTMHGLRLCWSYFTHAWDVSCGGAKYTPMDIYNDDEKFKSAIRKCWKLFNLVNDNTIRKILKIHTNSQAVSNFRPSAAKLIYEKFGGDVIWDMSCGWGGRLIGFLASSRPKYIGTEPSSETFKGLEQIKKDFFYLTKTIELHKLGSEIYQPDRESLDLCFTSPPYFDTEKYSDEGTQSYIKYPTKEEWINGFLYKTIENCYRGLKGNKYMLINIANTPKYKFIEEETIRISKELGFKQEKTIELTLSSVMGAGYKYEPIFVFKK